MDFCAEKRNAAILGTGNSTGVAIGFSQNLNININEQNISRDEAGRVLIIEASYDDKNFLLINFYNANNEKIKLRF